MNARQTVINAAKAMKGQRNQVVTLYNSFTPRARGYKCKDSDLLCAAFTSSVFIGLKWTELVPPEVAAWRLYRNMEALGCSHWGNDYTPVMGDLMFFGVGDSVSKIDHVGIFEKRVGNTYYFWDIRSTVEQHTFTPGNKDDKKEYGYILAWGMPDYSLKETGEPEEPVHEFAVGDLVTVNPGAKWYKGQSIKLSVINDKWYIMAIKGDRVVLGMNLAETRNIQSPIHTCDISLVVANGVVEQPPEDEVSVTITIKKATLEYLDILAAGNNLTIGQAVDLSVEEYL